MSYQWKSARIAAMGLFVLVIAGCDDSGETQAMPATGGMMSADMGTDALGGMPPEEDRCAVDDDCPAAEFCRNDPDLGYRVCAFGCRDGNCPGGQVCDPDQRVCLRDTSCSTNADCGGGEYCGDGECQRGCRLDDPEDCPRNGQGLRTGCDPETHTCVELEICCGAAAACSFELPGTCADPIVGERSCVNPNPCSLRCEENADCADELYCEAGNCVEGCRVQPDSCVGGEACNPTTRRCGPPPCEIDADCERARYCSDGDCIQGCRRDPDNCGQNQTCNERNRCEAALPAGDCVANDDCAFLSPNHWCDNGICVPPCRSNDECDALLACIGGVCTEGCRDDALEPNDSLDRARPLVFDGQIYDSGPGVHRACEGNTDWFRFDTEADGASIRIQLGFLAADADLGLRLYDPSGEAVAEADSADDDEVLEYLASPEQPTPAGTWSIEVFPRGLGEADYTLRVEVGRGFGPDAFENDDTADAANLIQLPDLVGIHTARGHTIHPGDEDWFAIDMGLRDGLVIRLEILGNDTGFDDDFYFEVYGPGLPAAGARSAFEPNGIGGGNGAPRFLEFVAPPFNPQIRDGRYYIHVYGEDELQFGAYRLVVEVNRDRFLCLEDDGEPNNRRDQAFDMMAVDEFVRRGVDNTDELVPNLEHTIEGLTLCSEEDWFSLNLIAGDDLEVRIERREPEPEGNTIVEIFGPELDSLSIGETSDRDNRALVRGVAESGRYSVRIASRGNTRTAYTLRVLRISRGAACEPDRYDRNDQNDARASSTVIEPGDYGNLTLCGADEDTDWFTFENPSLSTLTVALQFVHALGDLEVDVFAGDEEVALNAAINDGHSSDDNELVVLSDSPPGTYYVRVRGVNRPNVRYSLRVGIEERVYLCEDDGDEPNEHIDRAINLGRGEVDRSDQWICLRAPEDVDTFFITIPRGEPRVVASTFLLGDDGDLYLEIYDQNDMLVAETGDAARVYSKQCVSFPAADSIRAFYIRVVPLGINTVCAGSGECEVDADCVVEEGGGPELICNPRGQCEARGCIANDERLDYDLIVRESDDCDAVEPETPGIQWPRVE